MSFPLSLLTRRTLEVLGVLGAGQRVSPEDAETIHTITRSVIAMLEARQMISLSSELAIDAFPDELLLPLSILIAYHAAPSFGLSATELAALKFQADDAEDDIRSLTASGTGGQPTPGAYF